MDKGISFADLINSVVENRIFFITDEKQPEREIVPAFHNLRCTWQDLSHAALQKLAERIFAAQRQFRRQNNFVANARRCLRLNQIPQTF